MKSTIHFLLIYIFLISTIFCRYSFSSPSTHVHYNYVYFAGNINRYADVIGTDLFNYIDGLFNLSINSIYKKTCTKKHFMLENKQNEKYITFYKHFFYLITLFFFQSAVLISCLILVFSQKRKIENYNNSISKLEKELDEIKARLILQKKIENSLRDKFCRQLMECTNLSYLSSQYKNRIKVSELDWIRIVNNINVAFGGFTLRLKKAYPFLTDDDIRFCCLLKIKLNINTLTAIYCIQKTSIYKRKERIKHDKMGIYHNISLDDYLKTF